MEIALSDDERSLLDRVSRSYGAPYRDVIRARAVLALAAGASISEVARRTDQKRATIRKWGERFQRHRLRGLEDEPRSGRPARFSPSGGDAPGEAGV